MTQQLEAMKLWLEAIVNSTEYKIGNPAYEQAEASLRQAIKESSDSVLREQAQTEANERSEVEPVAQTVWTVGSKTFQYVCATFEDASKLISDLGMNTPSLYPSVTRVPLISYTSPPPQSSQRQSRSDVQPLTDELPELPQFFDFHKQPLTGWYGHVYTEDQMKAYATEAIKAAHGITGDTHE